jgi:hypothetical protein
MITIKLDTSAVKAAAERLERAQSEIRPAISRALNRAGDQTTTAVGRQLAEETGLGVRQVRQAMTVRRSTPASLVYEISIKGGATPLSEFAPRETRAGVSARPWGKRRVFPSSFMIGDDVVVRAGRERLPVRRLWGPSLATEAKRGGSYEKALEIARSAFAQRLHHELGRVLKGKDHG